MKKRNSFELRIQVFEALKTAMLAKMNMENWLLMKKLLNDSSSEMNEGVCLAR